MGESAEVGVLDGLRVWWLFWLWMLLCFATRMSAQGHVAASPLSSADTGTALTEMAARASVIFAGHVVSIARNDAAGFVDVRFGIDECVSGCPSTGEYGVREWAGLWAGQAPRYRVGQRFLMLLRAAGPAGMSTPVGSVDGAIPLVPTGAAALPDASGMMTPDAGITGGLAVDLRWVQARALRMKAVGKARSALDNTAVGGPVAAPSAASLGESTLVTLDSVLSVLRGVGSGAR